MSIAIIWQPTSKSDTRLDVPAPSQFMDIMRDCGYPLPCTLDDEDLPVMRAMAVVYGRNDQTPNPFKEIADLIVEHNSIDLYPAT